MAFAVSPFRVKRHNRRATLRENWQRGNSVKMRSGVSKWCVAIANMRKEVVPPHVIQSRSNLISEEGPHASSTSSLSDRVWGARTHAISFSSLRLLSKTSLSP
jgi:hypothetical protein